MLNVHITLKAKGQALLYEAPPILASGAINKITFDLVLSEEWSGFRDYYVIMRRSGVVRACRVSNGSAIADSEAIAGAGALEVSILAEKPGARITTERVILKLKDSGI